MTKQDKVIEYLYKLFEDKAILEGNLIPSENSLSIKMSLSRNTIRSALRRLVESNVIIPIRGKGYIYNETKSMELKSYGLKYDSTHTSLFVKERFIDEYEPDLKVQGYFELIKVRYKKDRPFILTYQRISKETKDRLKSDYRKSLYNSFKLADIKIHYAKKIVEFVDTPPEVKMLMPRSKSQSILLKSLTITENNLVLETSYNYYYPKEFSWSWIEKSFK